MKKFILISTLLLSPFIIAQDKVDFLYSCAEGSLDYSIDVTTVRVDQQGNIAIDSEKDILSYETAGECKEHAKLLNGRNIKIRNN